MKARSVGMDRAARAAVGLLATATLALASLGCGGGRHAESTSSAASPKQRASPPPATSQPTPNPPAETAAQLQPCLDHWNSPGNPTLRIRFATAAREAAAGTPLDDKALVLVYRGAPIDDVGVGVGGVNLVPGDCMVIHPANIMFAFTDGFWHQVGYTTEEPNLSALPKEAASAPNANVDLTSGIVTLTAAQ